MKPFAIGLLAASAVLAIAIAQIPEDGRPIAMVAVTPAEAAEMEAAEESLANARAAWVAVRKRIQDRVMGAVSAQKPPSNAQGCKESRTATVEGDQVIVRGVVTCASAEAKK